MLLTERTQWRWKYLVVPETKITQKPIVLEHIFAQFLDLGLVLEVQVPLKEALVELDNLTKRQMLPRRLVQPPCGLD